MPNTYTSDWIYVGDGDTQSHDTSRDQPININSTEVRWKGVKETNKDYGDRSNLDEFQLNSSNEGETNTLNIPDNQDGATFDSEKSTWTHEYVNNNYGGLIEFDYWVYDSNDNLVESGSDSVDNRSGNTDESTFYYNTSNQASYVKVKWTNIETTVDADSIETIHTTTTEFYTTSSSVTEDPSVTGDISTSYSGSLSSGETTSWKSVSNFAVGSNSWTQYINGSNNAYFQFRYNWEYQIPDVIETFQVHDNGTIYDLPLVDPNDSALEYDTLRYFVNRQELAADLVETSHPDASPVRIYDPTNGTLAWRHQQ